MIGRKKGIDANARWMCEDCHFRTDDRFTFMAHACKLNPLMKEVKKDEASRERTGKDPWPWV